MIECNSRQRERRRKTQNCIRRDIEVVINEAVLKTVCPQRARGFESHPLRLGSSELNGLPFVFLEGAHAQLRRLRHMTTNEE